MSGLKEHRSERSRKPDKMTPDSHREFLDMDTDEEDFELQESSEVEEEIPPEPEKPVFSEKSLITLVKYVKKLVVLPSIKDSDWNDRCYEIIRTYFQNPSYLLLSIFFKRSELTATLGLPNYPVKGFAYFSRTPWQIYTPENFLTTVTFGSINENVESSTLKFMENIYAPIVLNNNDYPSQVFEKSFSNNAEQRNRQTLSSPLIVQSSAEMYAVSFPRGIQTQTRVYKNIGLTMLYLPRERLLKTFLKPSNRIDCFLLGENTKVILPEEDEKKQKLADRLEQILWFWIRQIREVVKISTKRKNVKNILAEVEYWEAMHFNLSSLSNQLFNTEVRLIIDILTNCRSPNAELFRELVTQVLSKLEEASSNVLYLKLLAKSCENLNVPDGINETVTEALLLILFIWTESPFYNTINNMETLCRALGSQIINDCTKYIKLDVALGSKPEDGIQMIEECIVCCDTYKTIYDRLITNISEYVSPGKAWNINEVEVFDNIEIFKRRCYDVIDISKSLIVFGRCKKVRLLGSPKGVKYETYCREIENLFADSLNQIILARDIIFDVTKSSWLEKIAQFRNTITELENMLQNLINDIFEDVKNIEEGIEAIYSLQKFNQRECLREILQNKWTQVWQIFAKEIEYSYAAMIKENGNCDREKMLSIVRHLKTQFIMMVNASDWIGECVSEKCVCLQYERVLGAITKKRDMLAHLST